MVCPPPSIAWSALILWTITLYGVLGILSIFAASVHLHSPTGAGRRIVKILSLCDLGAAALAPVVIYWILGAKVTAVVVMIALLILAGYCRLAGRRAPRSHLPDARLHR